MNKQKTIWSLLNNVTEFATGIGLVVFITHSFTLIESGNWFLFIALFALISSLRDALIQSALIKSTVDNNFTQTNQALKTTLLVIITFESISGIVLISIGMLADNSFGKLLIFYPIYSFPNAVVRFLVFYLRGQLKIKQLFLLNLISLFFLSIALTLTTLFLLDLKTVIISLGLSNLIALCYGIYLVPLRSIIATPISLSILNLIWQYGKYAMLREAASAISSRISLFISGAFLTLEHTAILGVSQRFSQIALLPNSAFQSILFPMIMKSANANDKALIKKQIEGSLVQLLSLTIPFAILGVCISPMLLKVVSGKGYSSGWGLLSIYLLISTIITPFGTAFGSLVTSLGKASIAFKVVVVNSVLNVALSFILINRIGVWGAPLALLITETVGFCWIAQLSFKEVNLSFADVFKTLPEIYLTHFNKLRLSIKNNLIS